MESINEKDIQALKGDIQSSMLSLESQRTAYAQALMNGLGEEIKEKLRNPDKPNWKLGVRLRWRRRWNIFKEKVRIMLNGGGKYDGLY